MDLVYGAVLFNIVIMHHIIAGFLHSCTACWVMFVVIRLLLWNPVIPRKWFLKDEHITWTPAPVHIDTNSWPTSTIIPFSLALTLLSCGHTCISAPDSLFNVLLFTLFQCIPTSMQWKKHVDIFKNMPVFISVTWCLNVIKVIGYGILLQSFYAFRCPGFTSRWWPSKPPQKYY